MCLEQKKCPVFKNKIFMLLYTFNKEVLINVLYFVCIFMSTGGYVWT
jgi:hypothetical protein